MNLLNALNTINLENESKEKTVAAPIVVEAKSKHVYETDPDKRYEKILAILKTSNPKMHAKILNMD